MIVKKRPNKEQLFLYVIEELKKLDIVINGNISGFKDELYEEFVYFMAGKRFSQVRMDEFIDALLDALLDDNPQHVEDITDPSGPCGI